MVRQVRALKASGTRVTHLVRFPSQSFASSICRRLTVDFFVHSATGLMSDCKNKVLTLQDPRLFSFASLNPVTVSNSQSQQSNKEIDDD